MGHVNLPDDIAVQIAEYLAREFAEHGAGRISAADLQPLGERVIDEAPMQVWSFPTTHGPLWATVGQEGDSCCIGMMKPPPAPEPAAGACTD